MPKLKVDHIVSFSSEDPVHVANNILLPDTSKKWKCQTTGEKSASIILQLEKACAISSIDIGNEHSAYVEVLVNRSSTTEDFKVLLVMSSFMTPMEARQSTNINKVRMFRYDELQSPERDQKWDRVKIMCTQPFNRHVQYGLSFITLHTPEGKDVTAAGGQLKLGNFSLRPSSPDDLSVGSLFARRKELADDAPLTAAAAIREASSTKALTQGSRSPLCKPRLRESTSATPSKKDELNNSNSDASRSRNRDQLLYSKDEEEPNQKIDKLIEQKNKEIKEKQMKQEESKMKDKKQKQADKKESKTDKDSSEQKKNKVTPNAASTSSSRADTSKRKLNGKDTPQKKIKTDKQTKPFNQLLNGVMIVISGIQNPERATIRSEALAMGAKYKADWDDTSTHLICAFTNTPKFNQVKGKGKIVNRLWISDCHSQRKRLPWRRYALDSKDQGKAESEDEIWEQRAESPDIQIVENSPKSPENDDDGTDTEDEIDRIQALQKAKNKISDSIYSADTDEEIIQQKPKHHLPKLPDFLSNKVLYVDKELSDSNKTLLLRYITAYNGILVDDPSDVVDFAVSSLQSCDVLKSLCPEAQVVSPNWIWECHNAKRLVAFDNYSL